MTIVYLRYTMENSIKVDCMDSFMCYEEDDILKERIASIHEAATIFSNANKEYREKWVVEEFLKTLCIDFKTEEIIKGKEEPIDIEFKEAHFQVKEILDNGRKRHKEYKEALEKAKLAKKPSELFEFCDIQRMSLSDLFQVVINGSKKYEDRYSNISQVDLLFYVNLQDIYEIEDLQSSINVSLIKNKWRSLSFYEAGHLAYVLYASENAPLFLKQRAYFK